MSTDEEKDPPVPADVEGKIPKKVHDAPEAAASPVDDPDETEAARQPGPGRTQP
ncbi:hypothetical protein [Paenarthrobacter sp. NCHU4564]|uniref:hypothetical protein n=1 Tax=Paenarthrobacter sp. NCHU4564 TaxID=3451353 RepID=UPI003F9BEDEC